MLPENCEFISEFSKLVGYKINIQKSVSFLYTNNKRLERENKETVSFTAASKRIKYLGINLPKNTKDLYFEYYKMLMKEITDDTKRWKDIPCSWIGRISIVKLTVLLKTIYRFNAIPIKSPMVFLIELEPKILQFVWRHKRPRVAKGTFFLDFLMWTIFKVVIEFFTVLLLFYVLVFGHKACGILTP